MSTLPLLDDTPQAASAERADHDGSLGVLAPDTTGLDAGERHPLGSPGRLDPAEAHEAGALARSFAAGSTRSSASRRAPNDDILASAAA
jgi:hypothetical protein